jgi:hypothetical protein
MHPDDSMKPDLFSEIVLLGSGFWVCPMPSCRHTLDMSRNVATWRTPKYGGRPSATQNGPEVGHISDRENGLMKPDQNQSLGRILESAIVVSWADLMRGAPTGLIHIEYGFSAGSTLDYLRFLSSISPGHWLLVGEYWMQTSESHCVGFRFENGYQSERLLHLVESVMQHQGVFSHPEDLGPARTAPNLNAYTRRDRGSHGIGGRCSRAS